MFPQWAAQFGSARPLRGLLYRWIHQSTNPPIHQIHQIHQSTKSTKSTNPPNPPTHEPHQSINSTHCIKRLFYLEMTTNFQILDRLREKKQLSLRYNNISNYQPGPYCFELTLNGRRQTFVLKEKESKRLNTRLLLSFKMLFNALKQPPRMTHTRSVLPPGIQAWI